MPETTSPPESDSSPKDAAKSHFTKAMEEARAGAQALGKEALGKAGEVKEKLQSTSDDLAGQARVRSGEAREKAAGIANEGKARATSAMSSFGKLVEEQGDTVDGAVGEKYGAYVRTAGKSIQDTASKLDEKSFEEMGEDAKEFVRKSPALAVGMAAAAGFLLARVFRRK